MITHPPSLILNTHTKISTYCFFPLLQPLSLSLSLSLSLHTTMDSSIPTTPISHQSQPRLLRTKLEDPPESLTNSPLPASPSSTRRPVHSPNPVSLQDLLLLSPSPYRKSRPRPRPLIVDECIDPVAAVVAVTPVSRKKSKSSSRAAGASPRNARRARRRLEKEIVREERDLVVPFEEDGGRARKKKQSRGKSSRGERLALVASAPPLSPSPMVCDQEIESEERSGGGGPRGLILELVMWKNAAKSSLWFGLGTMFFLSSCFSKNVSFSMISAVSHLGLLVLGLAFFYDSFTQRQQQQKPRGENFKLTEEDILQVAQLILPMANAALAKSQEVFSGEPLMTLRVAPVLVLTAKYGHLITPWRLLATGFFLSFTLPKLYCCYSDNIQKKVGEMRSYVWEAWKSCPHKRFVAASTTMLLWNLFSMKMRLFAAFISVVILRYHHHQQHMGGESAENENREGELQQAITIAELIYSS